MSETKHETPIDAFPFGAFLADSRGAWVSVNDRLCDLLGMPHKKLRGDGWKRALHPDDRANAEAAWARTVAEQTDFMCELRFGVEERSMSWHLVQAGPAGVVGEAAGAAMMGIVTPLEARGSGRRAGGGAEETAALLGQVGLVTSARLDMHDMAARVGVILREAVACDAFFVDAWFPEPGLLENVACFDTIGGEFSRVERPVVPINRGGNLYRVVIEGRRPLLIHRDNAETETAGFKAFGDTSRRSASLLFVPLVSQGVTSGIVSVQSYRRKAFHRREVELVEAVAWLLAPALRADIMAERAALHERRLHALGENLPDGAMFQLVIEPDGRYHCTFVSGGVENLLGLKPGTLLADARVVLSRVDPAHLAGLDEAVAASVRGRRILEHELRYTSPAGETRWMRVRAIPSLDEVGRWVWDGLMVDVSDRKATMLELQRVNEQLRRKRPATKINGAARKPRPPAKRARRAKS